MKARIVYLSHGGGPLPLLGDALHEHMVQFLRELGTTLPRPKAIVVISAHWEETLPTLTSAADPPMLYDYYGFPREAYTISYPASGAPLLAERIAKLLGTAHLDDTRGFDHGMYVPLTLLYPDASIPTIQLSLLSSLSAKGHYEMGEALRPLLEEEILFIGSGFSFHNMRQFWKEDDEQNLTFQQFLIDTCTQQRDEEQRKRTLLDWEAAPFARYCHPREEHLLPLHVCQGLAGEQAQLVFDKPILKRKSVAFLWS